jgi:hypothetical protein
MEAYRWDVVVDSYVGAVVVGRRMMHEIEHCRAAADSPDCQEDLLIRGSYIFGIEDDL